MRRRASRSCLFVSLSLLLFASVALILALASVVEVEVSPTATLSMAASAALPKVMKAVFAEEKKCVAKEVPLPVPADGEVLIEVYATCLNRADTIIRKGLYPGPKDAAPKPLGLEAAGIVAALPAGGSKRGFKVGDRVMALLSAGGYAEFVAADESR